MRLIEFNESYATWLPMREVEDLIVRRVNFMDITDHQEDAHAHAGVSVAAPDPLPDQPIHKIYVNGLNKEISTHNLKASLTNLTGFYTRYYTSPTGVEAAKWIASQFEASVGDREDVTVELFTHTFAQPSVVATLPGVGPNKDQFVVIGAHEDSVGASAGGRSPGADDDGSGTVAVLEIFRVLLEAGYYPDRTVKFITYAGEEAGLLGSQAVANAFKNNGSNVYGVLQLDMIGYGGMDTAIGVVGDNVDAPLTAYVKILIDAYSQLLWVDTKCGYGCSDHASWTKAGYRAAFPFETSFDIYNPYIHSQNDLVQHIDFDRVKEFSKVGLAFVVELAGLTIRP